MADFDPSRFRPSLAFLHKVERGEVKRVRGYTRRKGGYDRFIGGEKQWEKHHRAGYVTRAPFALLGQPGVVELTQKGRDAIATEAGTATTVQQGVVHEGAGPKGIAQ